MLALRDALNRRLLLGLHELEAHYALYPAGAHYDRHRDRFRDDDARVLSAVLYLNRDWTEADAGALRLYLPDGSHQRHPARLPAGWRCSCRRTSTTRSWRRSGRA